MSDLTVIDCQGLGGAWNLGAAQAGFELVHRASLGAFGDDIVEHNRALLPGPWRQDPGGSVAEWEPAQGGFLLGTPPCSGFSLLNRTKAGKNVRGQDSAINNCMRELINYAGKCRGRDGQLGPEVVSFESVQQAYTTGRGLMQELRASLELLTGQTYTLAHVLLAGATVGSAQMRHRYYFVLHRIPFGIDPPQKRRVCTYEDAIGDLTGLCTDSWDAQDVGYRGSDADWWLNEQSILGPVYWEGAGQFTSVADHVEPSNGRLERLLGELLPYWPVGQDKEGALKAYRDINGEYPEWAKNWFYEDDDSLKGFNHETRIKPDRPGYVLTGGGVFSFIHWAEPRFLTVRECARLMGYPDAWSFSIAKNINVASNWIGKCCPVQSGRWISQWVAAALNGTPGAPLQPLEPGSRETYHNNTREYRIWLKEQRGETVTTSYTPRTPRKPKEMRTKGDKRYEFARSEHRKLRVREGDVCLDLGAHVGAWTQVALDAGASHVIAVEAAPRIADLLEAAVGGSDRVTVLAAAVVGYPDMETVTLYVPTREETTMASIMREVGEPVEVPAVALSELVERYRPDVVKIDIEGSEWPLLDHGAPELPGVRALCIEFHRTGAGPEFAQRIRQAFVDMSDDGWEALSNVPNPSPNSKWPSYGFWERKEAS